MRAMCRHCGSKVASRPRGLCWTCYYTAAIRSQYTPGSANPDTAKFAVMGVGNGFRAKKPHNPTKAAPGSEEKLLVMIRRAERGESLFHPKDNMEQPERPWIGKPHPQHDHGSGYEADLERELREAA